MGVLMVSVVASHLRGSLFFTQVFFDLMREVRKKKMAESKDKNGPSGKKKKKRCCIL